MPNTRFADNFNRPNDTDIGGNWSEDNGDFLVQSNTLQIQGNGSGSAFWARTTTAAMAAIADMGVQFTIVSTGSGVFDGGVFGRSTSAGVGYAFDYYTLSGVGKAELYHHTAFGTSTLIASANAPTVPTVGDVVRMEAVGTSIKGYINGSLVVSGTDSSITAAGQGGVFSWSTTIINVDDFQIDDAAAATLELEGFLFRNDNGSETAATSLAAQDTNATQALSTNTRLRFIVNATGDPTAGSYQIEYKKSSDSNYGLVYSGAPALPTWQAAGTAVNGTGSVTPSWPTHQPNDVAFLFTESAGGQAVTLTTANGFTEITNSPQATGSGTNGTRLTVFSCRATSSAMPSPVVGDPGDHVYAVICTIRGAIENGDAYEVTAGGVKAAASTSVVIPSVTTTIDNSLILFAASRDTDSSAAAFSSETNSNLGSVTERFDAGTTSGNGGGLLIGTGTLASHGASGTTGATVSNSINAMMAISIKPVSGAIRLALSSQFADGDVTTAQMTPPSAKTTSDFQTGSINESSNPAAILNLGNNTYTELEWNLQAVSPAANSDVYQFRITNDNIPLDTYSVTPQLTIGSGIPPLSLSGSITFSGASSKLSGKSLAGSTSYSGNFAKKGLKTLAGSTSLSGSLVKLFQKALAASISLSGSMIRSALKSLSDSVSLTGAIAKSAAKALAGSIATSATFIKQTFKNLVDSVSLSGTISLLRVILKSLTGSITLSGSRLNSISKFLQQTISPSGALFGTKAFARILTESITLSGSVLKSISKSLVDSITPSGILTPIKVFVKILTGAIILSGSALRQTNKFLSQTVSFSSTLVRSASRALSSTLNLSGQLLKAASRTLTDSVTLSGILIPLKVFTKILNSSISLSGSVLRQTNKSLARSVSLSTTSIKSISKNITSSLTLSGQLLKASLKILQGTITLLGNLIQGGGNAVSSWFYRFIILGRRNS